MDVGTHQVIQFVQDAVDDLHQQVAFLVLQGRGHQEGQDLIEQRPCPELTRLVRDLSEGSLRKNGQLEMEVSNFKKKKNLNGKSDVANE